MPISFLRRNRYPGAVHRQGATSVAYLSVSPQIVFSVLWGLLVCKSCFGGPCVMSFLIKLKASVCLGYIHIHSCVFDCLSGLPRWLSGKESTCQCRRCRRQISSLSQGDPLEEEMTTHSSILAWRIPWTEKPERLQSMESQRLGYNWACMHTCATLYPSLCMHTTDTHTHTHPSIHLDTNTYAHIHPFTQTDR